MRRALAVVCYNRPHYLRHCVDGILKNQEFLSSCDVIVFQDTAGSEIIAQNAQQWRRLPVSDVVVQKDGPHLERHSVRIREHVFDVRKYDRMFYLEDDVMLGRHALHVTDRLLTWCIDQSPRLGTVTTWNLTHATREEKAATLDRIDILNTSWFFYAQTREAWSAIAPHMKYYRDEYLRGRYEDMPAEIIRQWVRDMIALARLADTPSGVPSRSWMQVRGMAERLVNDPCAIGQDAATLASLIRLGHAKVSTVVNRVGYIGRTGTHVNPSVLFEHRLDEFSEDAALSQFRWIE